MSFGSYRSGTSFAHGLDPRTKLLFVLLYFAAAFCAGSAPELVLVAAVAVAVLAASGTTPAEALHTVKPFAWLIAFVLVFNMLFTRSGTVFFDFGIICVSTGGIAFGIESAVRFVCVLLGTSTLMTTTSPTELTDGITRLLRPFARIGVPVDDVALAVQMTFRFIPAVAEEFNRVKSAQEARLADFSSSSAWQRVKAYVPVLVPLFAGAGRRAATLALAIEDREYGTVAERSCLREYRMGGRDWAVLVLAAVLLVALVAL